MVLQGLVTQRPEATTALLMQLCTPFDGDDQAWLAKVADFTCLYEERCRALTPRPRTCLIHLCYGRSVETALRQQLCVRHHRALQIQIHKTCPSSYTMQIFALSHCTCFRQPAMQSS